jgi:hypothetical protein
MAQPLFRKAGLLDDEYGLHLLTLSVLLLDAFGPEMLLWESETLWEECTEKWGEIGPLTWEKIQALRVLHAHDGFWKEWEIFENICAAINGEFPIFSFVQPPDPDEAAIAIVTAARVDQSHSYSDEVKSYLVAACLDDGLWYFEGTPLEMCQEQLTEYDKRMDIQRRYADVAKALEENEGLYASPETAAEVQANKVREVQDVVSRYTASVDSQLRKLT